MLIDKRLEKFTESFQHGKNQEIVSIHLKDIDETFWFDDRRDAQLFLNKQVTERFETKELRTGSFNYKDEEGIIHKYLIEVDRYGKIVSYSEEIAEE